MTGDEFAVALLREERVAVAPGVGFAMQPEFDPDGMPRATPHESGAPFYPANPKASQRVRIAFCVSDEELREGLTRMVRFTERAKAARGAKAGA
jgi:aspartate/methionine/tyrosine aminotransferase